MLKLQRKTEPSNILKSRRTIYDTSYEIASFCHTFNNANKPGLALIHGSSRSEQSELINNVSAILKSNNYEIAEINCDKYQMQPFGVLKNLLNNVIKISEVQKEAILHKSELRLIINHDSKNGSVENIVGETKERSFNIVDDLCETFRDISSEKPYVIFLNQFDLADNASRKHILSIINDSVGYPHNNITVIDEKVTSPLWVISLSNTEKKDYILNYLSDLPAYIIPLGSDCISVSQSEVKTELQADSSEIASIILQKFKQLTEPENRIARLLAILNRPLKLDQVTAFASVSELPSGPGSIELIKGCITRMKSLNILDETEEGICFKRSDFLNNYLLTVENEMLLKFHYLIGQFLLERPQYKSFESEAIDHLIVSNTNELPLMDIEQMAVSMENKALFDEAVVYYETAFNYSSKVEDIYRLGKNLISILINLGLPKKAAFYIGKLQKLAEFKNNPELVILKAKVLLNLGRSATVVKIINNYCNNLSIENSDLNILKSEALVNLGKLEQAESLCNSTLLKTEDNTLGFELRNTLGKIYIVRSEFDRAKDIYELNLSKSESENNISEAARSLNNLGVVASRILDITKALDYYKRSRELRIKSKERIKEALLDLNIGTIYHNRGRFDEALTSYHSALSRFRRSSDMTQVTRCCFNLANLYLTLGAKDNAGVYLNYAVQTAAKISSPYLMAYAGVIAGQLSVEKANYSKALEQFLSSYTTFSDLQSTRAKLETGLELAKCKALMGDLESALTDVDNIIVENKEHSFFDINLNALLLKSEYCTPGDFKMIKQIDQELQDVISLLNNSSDIEASWRTARASWRLAVLRGDQRAASFYIEKAVESYKHMLKKHVNNRWHSEFNNLIHRKWILPHISVNNSKKLLTIKSLKNSKLVNNVRQLPFISQKDVLKPSTTTIPGMIGSDTWLRPLTELVKRVSNINTTILVYGESGTGKELVADAIHLLGPKSNGSIVKLNCGAIPDELLLSELFGHERGSFTGAVKQKKGAFEIACGGTLFLDEIGDISLKAQVAILRVLQSGEFRRVGGNTTLKTDTRVICATHRNLDDMVKESTFREDLYYRLSAIRIDIPPLRDRVEDVTILSEHFMNKISKEMGESPKELSKDAIGSLKSFDWPGNVRQFENVLRSALLFSSSEIINAGALKGIPNSYAKKTISANLVKGDSIYDSLYYNVVQNDSSLQEMKHLIEKELIFRALEESKGNIAGAARTLGMKRPRLSQIINADKDLKEKTKNFQKI